MDMDDEIAAYFAKADPWQQDAGARLRQAVLTAIPEAEESLQYKKPHYAVDGDLVAALHLAKGKVSLLILDAGAVAPEKGFLRSLGNGERKVVDVTDGQDVDVDRIASVLRAAHRG
jgi:hypothetical protein